MSTETIEDRLEQYGKTLEGVLATAVALDGEPAQLTDRRHQRSRRTPRLVAAAVSVVLVGLVMWAWSGDSGSVGTTIDPTATTASPVDDLASPAVDLAASATCLDRLDELRDNMASGDLANSPFVPDPHLRDATPVTIVDPERAAVTHVIIVGDTMAAVCVVPAGSNDVEWLSIAEPGEQPAATKIDLWGLRTAQMTSPAGPMSIHGYGRVGSDVVSVDLVVGKHRNEAVIEAGWFVVEAIQPAQSGNVLKASLEYSAKGQAIETIRLPEPIEQLPQPDAPSDPRDAAAASQALKEAVACLEAEGNTIHESYLDTDTGTPTISMSTTNTDTRAMGQLADLCSTRHSVNIDIGYLSE